MDLRGRLAIVTGAGGGLGRTIAVGLSRAGAQVLVADRDLAAAEATVDLVRSAGVLAWPLEVDLALESDVRLVAGRARELGGADLLVNNAGGWTSGGQQYPQASAREWSATLDLNLRSPMLLTQLFIDALDERPRLGHELGLEPGAVVNVASSAGTGTGGYASPEYATAKAGLVRFTTAMASPEVATRARVTCVVPGWVGLERAESEVAALSDEKRAATPALIPPGLLADIVVSLLVGGRPGTVVDRRRRYAP